MVEVTPQETKQRPAIKGSIQEKKLGENGFKPIAKVALWKQPSHNHPTHQTGQWQPEQPDLKGTVTYPNNAQQGISLWLQKGWVILTEEEYIQLKQNQKEAQ